MDLAKQAKIVDSIHDTLHDFVGQRLKVRANMGRSKIVESEGVLMQVHPQLFILEVDRKRGRTARQSYQYVDVQMCIRDRQWGASVRQQVQRCDGVQLVFVQGHPQRVGVGSGGRAGYVHRVGRILGMRGHHLVRLRRRALASRYRRCGLLRFRPCRRHRHPRQRVLDRRRRLHLGQALESVHIEGSRMDELGMAVFSGCSSLARVTFGAACAITEMGESVFAGTALEEVELPAALRTLPAEAFADCPNLVSVSLPASLEDLWTGASNRCPSLASVTVRGPVPVSYTHLDVYKRQAS